MPNSLVVHVSGKCFSLSYIIGNATEYTTCRCGNYGNFYSFLSFYRPNYYNLCKLKVFQPQYEAK